MSDDDIERMVVMHMEWGTVRGACDSCHVRTHCAAAHRCLAECTPSDIQTEQATEIAALQHELSDAKIDCAHLHRLLDEAHRALGGDEGGDLLDTAKALQAQVSALRAGLGDALRYLQPRMIGGYVTTRPTNAEAERLAALLTEKPQS